MKKIDDLKLQMYVDNELSKEESTDVENYLKITFSTIEIFQKEKLMKCSEMLTTCHKLYLNFLFKVFILF